MADQVVPKDPLASSEAQVKEKAAIDGSTPDPAPTERSTTHEGGSSMEEEGEQNGSDLVTEDNPEIVPENGIDPPSKNLEDNTQKGIIVNSGAPSADASGPDGPPGTLISQLKVARRYVNELINHCDYMVEEMSRRHECWSTEMTTIRKFLTSSMQKFFDVHQNLLLSKPEKEKFSALLVTDDDNYKFSHCDILMKLGNWNIEIAETGQQAIEVRLGGKSFDLIILHYDLEGLDGPRMVEWFRDRDAKSVIVGCVVFDTVTPKKRSLKGRGPDFYLKKPRTVSYGDIILANSQEFERDIKEYLSNVAKSMSYLFSCMERTVGIDSDDHGGV